MYFALFFFDLLFNIIVPNLIYSNAGLGKPVLVMRDTTERPEALSAGTVKLVGTDFNKIVNEVSVLLDDNQAYERMSKAVNPYGDGFACKRIVETLNNSKI